MIIFDDLTIPSNTTPSNTKHRPPPIPRNPPPNRNLNSLRIQLPRPHPLSARHKRRRRKNQRLPHAQPNNMLKQIRTLRTPLLLRPKHRDMRAQDIVPLGTREAVDNGSRREIHKPRRDRRFLCRDDDANAVVPLLADHAEEAVGEDFGGGGVRHVLLCQ